MQVLRAGLLVLIATATTTIGEQLPLSQPTGYSINVPGVPFTAEEVLSQPSQQYLSPDLSAAAAAPTVPAQTYIGPSAAATPQGSYAAPTYQAPAQYDFSYAVNAYDGAGNKVDFGHNEQRDGANTKGTYYVLLADTRTMRVDYYVDETGFHPTYTYQGEAVYPQAQAPSQLYTQPGRK